MAYNVRKTEHTGPKKGSGAFWGPKKIAKHGSNRKRRGDAHREVKESLGSLDAEPLRCAACGGELRPTTLPPRGAGKSTALTQCSHMSN